MKIKTILLSMLLLVTFTSISSQSITGGSGICITDANPNTVSGLDDSSGSGDCKYARFDGNIYEYDHNQSVGARWRIMSTQNFGEIAVTYANWSDLFPLFIDTNATPTSHNLPATWSGVDGDALTFMNKSGATKDLVGDIDNTPSFTLTTQIGETVRLIWDSTNTTWWVR